MVQIANGHHFGKVISRALKDKKRSSGTSDKGPSEIGMISLQRTLVAAPCFTSEIGTTSLQRTKTISPKVSLVQRFHCILTSVQVLASRTLS